MATFIGQALGWYSAHEGAGLIAAEKDRTVPASLVRTAYKIQKKNNAGVTEIVEFPGRGHSYGADSDWRDVADKALDFLTRHGMAPGGASG